MMAKGDNEANENTPTELEEISLTEDNATIEQQAYLEDKDFWERYQKYLEEGSVEVCPISQIIIVGEHGVGKTTLLYRLQGRSREEIEAIRSTRGAECHKKEYSFIITRNQLKMNKKGISSLSADPEQISGFSTEGQIQPALSNAEAKTTETENVEENPTRQFNSEETTGKEILEIDDSSTHRDTDKEIRREDHDKQADHERQSENDVQKDHDRQTEEDRRSDHNRQRDHELEPEHSRESIHNRQRDRDREPDHERQRDHDREPEHNREPDHNREGDHDRQTDHERELEYNREPDHNRKRDHDRQREHNREPAHHTRAFIPLLKAKLEERQGFISRFGNKDDVVLDVLDFAGQGEYYATHQTYIRKDAIFILVVDTSKDVNQRTENHEMEENKCSHAAIDKKFLCDRPGVAFQCWSPKDYFYYWLSTIRMHGGNSDNIIFVGTHKDQKRKDFDFDRLLYDPMIKKLIPEKYLKPVTTDVCRYDKEIENDITKIKNYIIELTDKRGREFRPAKWAKYSNMFDIIEKECPILRIEEVLEMVDHFDFGMSDTEVADMLYFFHSSGKIIFFNMDNLKEIVILNIQWFIDCFKYIISNHKHVDEDCKIADRKEKEMLSHFREKGVLEVNLFDRLLNQKGGIPTQYRDTLGEYQNKLGMMFYIKDYKIDIGNIIDGWYVPSVNTQEFKPNISEYGNKDSSQILCFRFKDYLPHDLFGRLIVACLNSGHWRQYDLRLYKAGADLCYEHPSMAKNQQIYLFTSNRIVTVQVIQNRSGLNGEAVRQEIVNIVRQLCHFYASSTEYEEGFLCRKEKGYNEDSVDHFVSSGDQYCHGCSRVCHKEWEDAESFWKDESHQDHQISTRREMDAVQLTCVVYFHVLKRTIEMTDNFRTPEDVDRETNPDSRWLDSLVEIGKKLKNLEENADEKKETKLRNMNECLKEVSRELRNVCKDLRKEIFFLWTQNTDNPKEIEDVPVVSMDISFVNVEIGTNIALQAKTDVTIRHHLWLRKTFQEKKYKVIYDSEEGKEKFEFQEKEDGLELTIKNFDLQDEGHYYVIVETEKGSTVCRKCVVGSKTDYRENEMESRRKEKIEDQFNKRERHVGKLKEDPSDILRKSFLYIKENLITHGLLLDKLLQCSVLSDEEKVNFKGLSERKICRLLKHIINKGEEACRHFLEVLKNPDYGIFDRIEEVQRKDYMTVESKVVIKRGQLKSKYETLLVELEPSSISDFLFQENVFDIDTHDEIENESRRIEKVRKILKKLEDKSDECLKVFVHGLYFTKQQHILDVFQNRARETEKETCLKCVRLNFREIKKDLHFELTVEHLFAEGIIQSRPTQESAKERGRLVKSALKSKEEGCYSLLKHLEDTEDHLFRTARSKLKERKKHGRNPVKRRILESEIKRYKSKLKSDLQPSHLIDILLEEGVLSPYEHDELEDKPSRRTKAESLLSHIIQNASQDVLDSFAYALEVTGVDFEEIIKTDDDEEDTVSETPHGKPFHLDLKILNEQNPDSQELIQVVLVMKKDPRDSHTHTHTDTHTHLHNAET